MRQGMKVERKIGDSGRAGIKPSYLRRRASGPLRGTLDLDECSNDLKYDGFA
jgi:hypothetical protein